MFGGAIPPMAQRADPQLHPDRVSIAISPSRQTSGFRWHKKSGIYNNERFVNLHDVIGRWLPAAGCAQQQEEQPYPIPL